MRLVETQLKTGRNFIKHLLTSDGVSTAAITLLSDGKLDTLALGQGDPGLLSTNDEDVGLPGGEGVVNGILNVDNVETTIVTLTVGDDTNTTHVTTTSDHGQVTNLELDKVVNLASGQAAVHGVVDLDERVRVADAVAEQVSNQGESRRIPTADDLASIMNRSSIDEGRRGRIQPKLGPTADRCRKNSRSRIMRNQEWDTATAQLDTLDLAELVLGLLGLDAVDREAALGVVDEAEVLAGLLDGDDVHEAGRVGHVGADLAVDLDQALHQDRLDLTAIEGVLEAVADEDDEGQAVASLVRTGGGLGGVGAGQLVQQPVLGRTEALLVLLSCSSGRSQHRRRVVLQVWPRGRETAWCPGVQTEQCCCTRPWHFRWGVKQSSGIETVEEV
ncbi:hypothetical protein FJTKL_11881 [Diaporthe vaccinii]|uniref:Uncharacterized protein n=1 Tax=Diaporthe vaccinii TaxID=105482 RepID=A0ABR4FAD7_9PEZI